MLLSSVIQARRMLWYKSLAAAAPKPLRAASRCRSGEATREAAGSRESSVLIRAPAPHRRIFARRSIIAWWILMQNVT
jgi:hypothetical protein